MFHSAISSSSHDGISPYIENTMRGGWVESVWIMVFLLKVNSFRKKSNSIFNLGMNNPIRQVMRSYLPGKEDQQL